MKVLEPQWSLSAQVLVQQARLMVQVPEDCLSHRELHFALAESVPWPSAHELASNTYTTTIWRLTDYRRVSSRQLLHKRISGCHYRQSKGPAMYTISLEPR